MRIILKRKPKVQFYLDGQPLPPSGCLCPGHDDYECSCKHMNTENISQTAWEMLNRSASRIRLLIAFNCVNLAATLVLVYLVFAK